MKYRIQNSCAVLSCLSVMLSVGLVTGVQAAQKATATTPQVATPQAVSANHADFNGVWLPAKATQHLLTMDGKEPPLKPEAKALYEKRQAARKAGDTSFDRTTWCASPGLPRFMFIMHPFEIAVSERRIGFIYSWNNWYRTVDMRGVDWDVDDEYSSVGVGMGHWQKNTLVINTKGLRADPVMDRYGLPQSGVMKMTERMRLLGKDVLEIRFRFDDEENYLRPWETVMTYRRQPQSAMQQEFVCLDELKKGHPGLIED